MLGCSWMQGSRSRPAAKSGSLRAMSTPAWSESDATLVETCRERAIALLRANLTPAGILAATPGPRAAERGYTSIFARDAAVCALGMALSGEHDLERAAADGMRTIAAHQAGNGQMAKFVDVARREADFWYLGCIDATLWWLVAVDFLDRRPATAGLAAELARHVAPAITWLQCQEHQRFRLLQQNEASDWADIMPRSGFVLYTNALWHLVKRLYRLPDATATRRSANELFHPFSTVLAEYRRARLLAHYVRRTARHRDLFLSFVNLATFGDEGDVFGNLLALECGLADGHACRRTLRALSRTGVDTPWPVRAVCDPILEDDRLWRPYMSRHRQNFAWQYHNGGAWPFVGAFWVLALARWGESGHAARALVRLAAANALAGWGFHEWMHGQTGEPCGMRGQSWSAAAFLLAHRAVHGSAAGQGGARRPFVLFPQAQGSRHGREGKST